MADPKVNVEIVNPAPEEPIAEVVVVETPESSGNNEMLIKLGMLIADIEVIKNTVEELKYKTESTERTAESAIEIAVETAIEQPAKVLEPVVEEIVTEVIPAPVEAEETEPPVERAKKKRHFI